MKQFYTAMFTIFTMISYSQIGIGTTTPNAALEIASTTNGVVIPRIALTSKLIQAPVVNPQGGGLPEGTLIWNTATAGTSPNNVTPGFYFWSAGNWNAIGGVKTRDWALDGNNGTTPGTNFIGTTDNVTLRVKTNNADRFDFTNNGRLLAYDNGTAGQPTYSWNGNNNTGFYRPSANVLSFTTNGTDRLRIPNANQVHAMSLGTAALPFYTFDADSNTGVYSPSSDALGFSTNGIERFRIPNTNQVHAMSLGTAAAPFYSFSSDTNTGIYSAGADVLNFSTNGAERMRLLANGQVSVNMTAPPVGSQFSVSSTASAINGYGTTRGVYGQTITAGGSAVLGLTNNNNADALNGQNLHPLGTGVVGLGNNQPFFSVLINGSGGAFTGNTTAIYGKYMTGGTGQGLLVQDDYSNQWMVGAFDFFGDLYKVIGPGSVSTIVKDLNDKKIVMFSSESPESFFTDYGQGKLVNGKAKVIIDPVFSKNIKVNEKQQMKVFIQLEGDCNGVYVTNKSAESFEVIELQNGSSNVSFTYSITANRADEEYTSSTTGEIRKVTYDKRFPPAPAHQENIKIKKAEIKTID